MNERVEFTRAVRRDALKRAGTPPMCEATGVRYGLAEAQRCNAPLAYGVQFDHYIPWEFSRDSGLDNCRAICIACHKFATPNDVRAIRKSDRMRDKHTGAMKPSPRGFRKPPGTEFDWRHGRYVRPSRGPDRDAQTEIERGEK